MKKLLGIGLVWCPLAGDPVDMCWKMIGSMIGICIALRRRIAGNLSIFYGCTMAGAPHSIAISTDSIQGLAIDAQTNIMKDDFRKPKMSAAFACSLIVLAISVIHRVRLVPP